MTLVGNDLVPTTPAEAVSGTIIVLLGSIIIGTIIGEFANIMSSMSKKATALNEELDMVASVMIGLKVPE